MRAQDQKLSRPPGPTRPDHGRGLGERTLEGFVRRLQLQKTGPVRVRNVGNQKTHEPPVLCAFVAFETETSWYRRSQTRRIFLRRGGALMLTGAHIVVYSKDAEAD